MTIPVFFHPVVAIGPLLLRIKPALDTMTTQCHGAGDVNPVSICFHCGGAHLSEHCRAGDRDPFFQDAEGEPT